MYNLSMRMKSRWPEDSFLELSESDATCIGFNSSDARVISRYGIPYFSAPHIILAYPFEVNSEYIRLAFNQYDGDIIYFIDTGSIYSDCGQAGMLLAANNFLEFLNCLTIFLESVDEAIARYSGPAFEERPLPDDIRKKIVLKTDIVIANHDRRLSFWRHECDNFYLRGYLESE